MDEFVQKWPETYLKYSENIFLPQVIMCQDKQTLDHTLKYLSKDRPDIEHFALIYLTWPVNNLDMRPWYGEYETLVPVFLKKLYKMAGKKNAVKKWKKKLENAFPRFTANEIIDQIIIDLCEPFCWNNFTNNKFCGIFSRTLFDFWKLSTHSQQIIEKYLPKTVVPPLLFDSSWLVALKDDVYPDIKHFQDLFSDSMQLQYEKNHSVCLECYIITQIFRETNQPFVVCICSHENILKKSKKSFCFC